MELDPERIRIVANNETGLFYGVGTLVQLLTKKRLPEGEVVDWPELPMRHIYWDDSHHLERLDALKAAVREASLLKINGFVLKLDGHFAYRSAPAAVDPQALSPSELQELTDYGLHFHVQVIPYLDAPAHLSFLLKHPEYAALRAFPDNNYEMCATNTEGLRLLDSMYGDLLAANRGVHYFYLSTDEAYYVGMAENSQCNEKRRADELGSRGKLWAEFLTKAASFLQERGREVIFWGEYPLKPGDIASIPKNLIDGETYGEAADAMYRERGIRQMIYEPVEGEEPLFPHYYLLPRTERLHKLDEDFARVPTALEDAAGIMQRGQPNLIGEIVAGWGDAGLHPETFWLGYATVAAEGWNRWTAGGSEAMASFYTLWYGEGARDMARVYQLLSLQAQGWGDTWDSKESDARPGIWGDSKGKFPQRRPARDQTLPLPPPPERDLRYTGTWRRNNTRRLALAAKASMQNDTVQGLIEENLFHVDRHRYDLEVFLSIAQLCRQNLDLLEGFAEIDEALSEASAAAQSGKAEEAVASVDRALAAARAIRAERNQVWRDAVATWQKTWMPRVKEANGRVFLASPDDVKDHLPGRTADMSYLVYRELLLPIDDWYERTQAVRNSYAAAHHMEQQRTRLRWSDLAD